MKSPTTRCDEVVVQVIVRSYDAYDRPIGEAMTQPTKVFRSQAPDFWRYVDDLVRRASRQATATEIPKRPVQPEKISRAKFRTVK